METILDNGRHAELATTLHLNDRALATLRAAGIELDRTGIIEFPTLFEIEPPVVIHGELITDNPFSIRAFSASYGGRRRNVQIGRYCSIAPDLQTGWDNHPTDWGTSSMLAYVRDVHGWASFTGHADWRPEHGFLSMPGVTEIGNDVWIGYGAFIAAGVKIGDGAVIGAKSVVTKDVPPYAVAVGAPARVLRYRYSETVIADLLRVRWWRYNLLDFKPGVLNDIHAFLDHVEEVIEDGVLEPYVAKVYRPEDLQTLIEAS